MKKKKLNKKLSPKNANTFKKVCSLKTDSFDTKDFWILIDADFDTVYIHEQRTGEGSKQEIAIKKKDFNKLIDWYLKDQTIQK